MGFHAVSFMKFEVGDTVLVVHSAEEGVIVDIVDEQLVHVSVKGTVFPVYVDQLDFPYFKRFTEKRKASARGVLRPGEELPLEKKAAPAREETGVFLSFLPEYEPGSVEPVVEKLKIHLANETAGTFELHYQLWLLGGLELEVRNRLYPFQHIYVQDLPFDQMNDRPRFDLEFSLVPPDPAKADTHQVRYKPKPRQIMQQLHQLAQGSGATFSYRLFHQYPARQHGQEDWNLPAGTGKPPYVSPQENAAAAEVRYEVDLHIEKLVADISGLTPTDMLAIQLGELHRQLDQAVARRQFSMVVIHGVGKGTLRDEVHEMLRHMPEVKSFVNQYDFRYGYGATEIFFQYK